MSTTSRVLATKASRRTVGIRDAKARLSELLRDAQLGHEWTITERGKPIARIVPIAAQATTLEERVRRLVARGVIDAAPPHSAPLPPPLRLPVGIARQMLDDDRNA